MIGSVFDCWRSFVNWGRGKNREGTALHWAAKHGDANVIKLIAGAYKVNPNIRSGYTPVHLAALYKHDMIIHLLVHTYGEYGL
ncbi:hypothetical protein TNIN_468691 [Trichonephila inaurata madagascariensis]|uniref:Uncharacterized protein n=1 Tax=Trichonephila inaurata madagascariensis TaxID=2747483 RepID=A0A8X6I779_9ARAC|nr:hypothetical protein TNIN_468691 [Trichonephila inaurata madagascariensis]